MYLDRYDDAIRALERWQPAGDGDDAWSAYARFNIGVALVRKERLEDAAKLLDAVGQIDAPTEELAALRDKANLALGYAWLKAGQRRRSEDCAAACASGRPAIEQGAARRRLGGLRGEALHQSARAVAGAARPQHARRGGAGILSRGAVRVCAARREQAGGRAVHARRRGVRTGSRSASTSRSRRFATASCSTRSSRTTRATRSAGTGSCSNLPDAPETRYLYHLLASHEFQEGLKNYRDLRLMQRNLATWSLSVAAFEDMVDTRRRAFARARARPGADARHGRSRCARSAQERARIALARDRARRRRRRPRHRARAGAVGQGRAHREGAGAAPIRAIRWCRRCARRRACCAARCCGTSTRATRRACGARARSCASSTSRTRKRGVAGCWSSGRAKITRRAPKSSRGASRTCSRASTALSATLAAAAQSQNPLSGRDRRQGARIAEGAPGGVFAAGALRAGVDLRPRIERAAAATEAAQ